MHVQALKLSKRLTDLLLAAQLETVEQVQQAGRDGLIAIGGIGPASADEILAAAAHGSAPPDKHIEPPLTPPKTRQPPDGNAHISVRNTARVPVLVGGRYMFPGDIRTIRRHQIKPGLVGLDSGA